MTGWQWFLALGPLSVYLMLMGFLNLVRRPVLLTGMQDRILLGLAILGLIVVGPVDLFLPLSVYAAYGSAVWLIALVLLVLVLGLGVLTAPPKIVILNVPVHQVRSIISETAVSLDTDSRWAGDCLLMPNLGVQCTLIAWPSWRNVTLAAVGPTQDFQGWKRFGVALSKRLATVEVRPNPRGIFLVALGGIVFSLTAFSAFRDPRVVADLISRLWPL
ncbi:hypothetical protein [Thermogutta sp.]|uniref:hypothetical protein n=1 Tax=Thermogutta sp. TaxID=1962930 RepID=UPI00321FF570